MCSFYLLFFICRDNVPTHLLKSWEMRGDMFDGEILAGLVPTLFSDDPDRTAEAVCANPAKTHWDIQRINCHFLQPEYLTVKAAYSVVKKPRYVAK